MEKFSLPGKNSGKKDEKSDDLNLVTKKELAHYVRSIPLVNSKMDVWNSPEFLLALREGNVIDHALLMAGLFMTVDEEEEKKT